MSGDREPAWGRRRLLATLGATGTIGLAGCFNDEANDAGADETTPTPVADPEYDLSVDHPPIEEWDGYDPDWEPASGSPLAVDVEIEVLVENLEIPWDLSFTDNGEVFVTERPGQLSRYDTADLEVIADPDDVIDHATAIDVDEEGGWFATGGEGGLLGCAAHPNYPDVPVVYAFYTYETGGEFRNRLVYYDVSGSTAEETVLIDDVPGHEFAHNGARLAFGPRNYLWVTMGDAEPEIEAYTSDLSTLAGTIVRIEPDGAPAPDNPDIEGADPRIYSHGHRNPQGIDWLPDGTPIVSEHGPSARDEVLLARPGDDHGWPPAREGPDHDSDSYESYTDHPDVAPPLVNTGPDLTWAPSGAVFYRGGAIPEWRNRFLVGGLISQELHVVTPYPAGQAPDLEDGTRYDADWLDAEYDAIAHQTLGDELGRIRHVEEGPDGEIYAITSNRDGRARAGFPVEGDDVLVRLRPA